MSLRLPPGTPLATVTEYEDVCRDLSSTLGQRPSLVNPANGNLFGVVADTTSHLARGVGTSLESLARILDTAGVVGPLISLLSLLSSLILLFPPFALHFLNVPLSPAQILPPQGKHKSKLLALLARVVKRFGRPAPVVRAGEKSGRGGKARERTRRVRGVAAKPAGSVDKAGDDERVELESAKRIALLSAVVEVLEGLSWRMTERAKDRLVDFLHRIGAWQLIGPSRQLRRLSRGRLGRRDAARPSPAGRAPDQHHSLPLLTCLSCVPFSSRRSL